MTTNAKIKVIKKGEQPKAQEDLTVDKKSTQESAREMVSTVTNWVNDFQQRRREDTKQAIEKLFSQQTQPNGA
jgi:hypothetical protein